MEKRLDTFKKQADTMLELETELVKSKKSERGYEEAVETLQKDLGDMEDELSQLKASGAGESYVRFCRAEIVLTRTVGYDSNRRGRSEICQPTDQFQPYRL